MIDEIILKSSIIPEVSVDIPMAPGASTPRASDPVDHPAHYTSHQSGIECIEVTEHMNFNLGNAMKYIWRCEGKNGIEDLRKAVWYLNREIQRSVNSNVTAKSSTRLRCHAGRA